MNKLDPFDVLSWAGVIALIAGVLIAGYCCWRAAAADGQVTYCYTEYWSPSEMPPMIRLFGFRPWRSDRRIGNYKDLVEATEAAKLIGCKIEDKQ